MTRGLTPLCLGLLCGACVAPTETDDGRAPGGDEPGVEPQAPAAPAAANEKVSVASPSGKPWQWSSCRVMGGCDDNNPCTHDICKAAPTPHCEHEPIVGSCDDGDPCTFGDVCVAGYCEGADRVALLSGDAIPEMDGWTLYGETGAATSDGSAVYVSTLGMDNPKPYAMYARDLDASVFDHFDIEWSMQIISSSHNAFDAGVAFFPSYSGYYGLNSERPQMIYFDPSGIGWGDESQAAWFDASVERLYRLHIDPDGVSKLYVDGEVALTREDVATNGTIAFGDQTNDTGVDGDFIIRDMALVPALSCMSAQIE